MTKFDLQARLSDLAVEITPGPARRIEAIEAEARRLRRASRGRWALAGAAAATLVAITVPLALTMGSRSLAPTGPADPTGTPSADDRSDVCTPMAAKVARGGAVLIESDCTTRPLELELATNESPYAVSLSPDAGRVAYSVGGPGEDRLEVRDLRTGRTRTIATSSDTIGDPVWSPDGEQLAFWRNETGVPDLYIADVDEGTAVPIPGEDPAGFGPSWSPDGSQLAFASEVTPITILNVETGQRRELSESPLEASAFWGGDGSTLFTTESRIRSASFRILQLDPGSGAVIATSRWVSGSPLDAVGDVDGIRVAAPALEEFKATVIMTFDYGLTLVDQQTIDDAQVTNLRSRER